MAQRDVSDAAEMWGKDEYQFHGQRANEKVLLVRNQHWVVLLPAILISLVSLVIPYAVIRWLGGLPELIGAIIYGLWLIFYLGKHIYSYANGLSILSDQRLLNVDQRGLFNRRITEAELSRIQDVSTESSGILQTMFHFGQVTIRTASKDSLLVLKNIGDPYDVQQAIVRALNNAKNGHSDAE